MRFVLGWLKSAGAVLLAGVLASGASAGVIVSIAPSGNDVVATVSGSWINLSGFQTSDQQSANVTSDVDSNSFSTFNDNQLKNGRAYYGYTQISGASRWGTSSTSFSTIATSSTVSTDFSFSDYRSVVAGGIQVFASPGFPNGSAITGALTFQNKTMASMGLDNYGTFVYKLGTTDQTITFVLSSSSGGAVPEPTSMAIFGLGAIGLAYRARRKAKA